MFVQAGAPQLPEAQGLRGKGPLTRCRSRSASARCASNCCLHWAAAALASLKALANLLLLSCSAKNSASHCTSPTELRGRKGRLRSSRYCRARRRAGQHEAGAGLGRAGLRGGAMLDAAGNWTMGRGGAGAEAEPRRESPWQAGPAGGVNGTGRCQYRRGVSVQ